MDLRQATNMNWSRRNHVGWWWLLPVYGLLVITWCAHCHTIIRSYTNNHAVTRKVTNSSGLVLRYHFETWLASEVPKTSVLIAFLVPKAFNFLPEHRQSWQFLRPQHSSNNTSHCWNYILATTLSSASMTTNRERVCSQTVAKNDAFAFRIWWQRALYCLASLPCIACQIPFWSSTTWGSRQSRFEPVARDRCSLHFSSFLSCHCHLRKSIRLIAHRKGLRA